MPSEPLDEVQWRAPEWIQMYGLRTDNVLEYFAQSPFYDRTSNNQVLKMQSQFNEGFHTNVDIYRELQNMTGVEFVVALAKEPEMWVIRKQNRLGPQDVHILSTYYVLGENIYQSPSVYSIMMSRLLSSVHSLNNALSNAMELPTYSPSQGYTYITEAPPIGGEDIANVSNGIASSLSRPAAIRSKTGTAAPSPAVGGVNTPLPFSDSSLPSLMVDEKSREQALSRALAFTVSNSTIYLDSPDREVGSIPEPTTKRTTQPASRRRKSTVPKGSK